MASFVMELGGVGQLAARFSHLMFTGGYMLRKVGSESKAGGGSKGVNSVIYRLVALVVLALVLEGFACAAYFSVGLWNFSDEQSQGVKADIVAQKKTALQDLVRMAYSTVDRYYNQSLDEEALKAGKSRELAMIVDGIHHQISTFYKKNVGSMERDELEQAIKDMVAAVRYDGDNYIWINDMHPTMVMHPAKPALDGQDLSNFKDPQGTFLFNEMVEVCKEKGAGMVAYMWAKPNEDEPKPKVSYVKLVKELNWIIGTGAWIEDITEAMKLEALDQVSKLRLEDGNYFWINDMQPAMVMHPIKPELNGQDLTTFKDPKGTFLFNEMVKVCSANGQGFVEYWWGKPGVKDVLFPKTSFVRLFEPWGWVIGMGVYMDDVDLMVIEKQAGFAKSIRNLL
ncbi:MAG: cache domain-containing protein, partial [Proteobacteria bacterium]|nr:cache domain-containing protein [Pseudomonadota bacterium]